MSNVMDYGNLIDCSAIKLINGMVFTGLRHAHCFKNVMTAFGNRELAKGAIQGFVTMAGDFVTREEAAKIALESGQIKELKYSKTQLFSEEIIFVGINSAR